MSGLFSYCRTHLAWIVVSLGFCYGMIALAQASPMSGDVHFRCWTWIEPPHHANDGESITRHSVSVRGIIHRTGVLHSPVLLDVDGHLVARYSGASYSTGRDLIQIQGIRSGPLGGRLILRYFGEHSNLNYFFYSPDPHARDPHRTWVDTDQFDCRFVPAW
jgi:hypothetical protein